MERQPDPGPQTLTCQAKEVELDSRPWGVIGGLSAGEQEQIQGLRNSLRQLLEGQRIGAEGPRGFRPP